MSSSFRRRLNALECAGFVVTSIVDGRGAEAFTAFIAETFGREHGSHADAAARLFGLPAARHFLELCKVRFESDAHARIARQAYGHDWQQRCDEVAEVTSARCREVHGDGWAAVLADRIANAKRVSRYQSSATAGGIACR